MDDPRGPALVEISKRPVTYAINAAADVTPGSIDMTLSGLRFDVKSPKGTIRISVEAGRPAERLQHPRSHGDRRLTRRPDRRD
jgi:hypothetical protein